MLVFCTFLALMKIKSLSVPQNKDLVSTPSSLARTSSSSKRSSSLSTSSVKPNPNEGSPNLKLGKDATKPVALKIRGLPCWRIFAHCVGPYCLNSPRVKSTSC